MKLIVTVPELECGASDNGMISLTNTTTMMFAISRAVLFVTVASGGIIPRLTRLDIETRIGFNRLLVVRWSNAARRARVIVGILVR